MVTGAMLAAGGATHTVGVTGSVVAIVCGAVLSLVSLFLWLDIGGMATRYYQMTIRSWRRMPVAGESWVRNTPYSRFRRQSLVTGIGGVIFICIGTYGLISR
jgi:hypothetical protein